MADVSDGHEPVAEQKQLHQHQQCNEAKLQRAEPSSAAVGHLHETTEAQQQQQPPADDVMGPPRAKRQPQQQAIPQRPRPAPEQQQQQQQQPNPEQQQQPNADRQQAVDPEALLEEDLDEFVKQELQLEGKLLLYELLRNVYDRAGETDDPAKLRKAPAASYVKGVQRMVDAIKCRDEKFEEYPVFALVLVNYQRLLQLCNALDYNDLLRLAVKLLTEHPRILEQQVRRWPFLLVDEFQDCNRQQTDLVNLLQGARWCVTVVGDDAQSIYGFRGAVTGIFEVYKVAYAHNDLQQQLELNYRSTPQILAVGRAMLTNSEVIPKDLRTTVPAEDKPPVRLLVMDTEEHEAMVIAKEAKRLHEEEHVEYGEMAVLFRAFKFKGGRAHTKLQQALYREGIPFVLVRDTSLFQRVEVLDVTAYISLALNQNDDAAFMRVLNVPKRGLGKKLIEQLEEEHEEALTALVQPQQDDFSNNTSPDVSFFSIAQRLLRQGKVKTTHVKGLTEFVNLVKHLSGVIKGANPAEAVLAVLQQVPGLVDYIKKAKQDRRKQAEGVPGSQTAADDGNKQQQQQEEPQESQSQSAAGTEGTAADAAVGDEDDDDVAEPGADDSSSDEEDDEIATPTVRRQIPQEARITPALAALYEEAVAFSNAWAQEHGVAQPEQPCVPEAAGDATEQPSAHGKPAQEPAAANGDSSQQLAASGSAAKPSSAADAMQADESGTAAADSESIGPGKLFDLVAQQVTSTWPSVQLTKCLPDFLLEEIYGAIGKGARVVSDFLAHLTLNPHSEEEHNALMSDKAEVKRDALVISTVHAAKGLEYNTVFVVRWVQGFLPGVRTGSSKTDSNRALMRELIVWQATQLRNRREQEQEEQRLAHVAVTRAKVRLILTRPRFDKLPELKMGYKDLTLRQIKAILLDFPELQPSSFWRYLKGLNDKQPGTIVVEDLSTFPYDPTTVSWDVFGVCLTADDFV